MRSVEACLRRTNSRMAVVASPLDEPAISTPALKALFSGAVQDHDANGIVTLVRIEVSLDPFDGNVVQRVKLGCAIEREGGDVALFGDQHTMLCE